MPVDTKPVPHLSEQDNTRFDEKINFEGPLMPGQTECCHIWLASKRNGYGQFYASGELFYTHRVAFARAGGSLTPENPQVNHACGRRDCVNPNHLYAGTQVENMRDREKDGTVPRGDRHGSHTKPESRPRGSMHHSRTKPECTPRGEKHCNCKLSDVQVAYVRASPLSGVAIARELGVHPATISDIRLGKIRKPFALTEKVD